MSYPDCYQCGVPPVTNVVRDVSHAYAEGKLTGVSGYIPSLSYAANGVPTGITHQNAVVDSLVLDPSGRAKSITFEPWSSCGTAPAITSQPAPQTINSGQSATLAVTATGMSLQYQWYESANGAAVTATAIAGATQPQYTTPALTASKWYFVRISNACRSLDSAMVKVTVNLCAPPSITAQPQSTQISSGASTTLTVTASGSSLVYQWYAGASGNTSQPVGTNSASHTTPPLTETTMYWVRVTSACGAAASATAVVTVPLPTPTDLVARMETSTSVKLTWALVSGASRYEVWRRSGGGSFQPVATVLFTPWIDTQRTAGTTYVYQVRALDANHGSASGFSSPDHATLMSFTPITAGQTVIDDTHVHELRSAVNALRAAAGQPALSWTSILPSGVPEPAPNVVIRRAHVEGLREVFTNALQALGMPAPPYTNPNLVTAPAIRAVHVTELQQHAQ